MTFVATEDAPLKSAEIVFSALPHGTSAEWVNQAMGAGARVIDLSQDFRPGTGPEGVPYGLTELMRSRLAGAQLVANPGCYPTAVLIALAPAIARQLIPAGSLVNVSAASGVTGAGSSPRPDLLFAEITEDFRAYGAGNVHRHLAEMRAVSAELGGDFDIVFTPHLLPVARGILATITIPLSVAPPDAAGIWRDFYAGERFIEVRGELPSLRDVVRRNVVRLCVTEIVNVRKPALLVVAAIDNLLKGAAGQAVQNANALAGFEEWTGLPV